MVSEIKMVGILPFGVVLFFLGCARSDPTYGETDNFNVTEGHPFSSKCPTDQDIVYWQKKGKVISTFKTLNFVAISRTEAGYYSCYVLSTKKLVETIYINVQYPAKILNVSKQSEPLHANQTYSISVDIEGNPSPNTTLTSEEDGQLVYQHSEVGKFDITMVKVQCADGGTYQLRSQNTLGDDTRDEEILVYCPPSPSSRLPIHDRLKPRLGDNVILKVVSMGYPYPTYNWTHDGKEVHSMNKHFETDVELKWFELEEFGGYTLTMTNDLGETNHTFQVIADGPPGPVTALMVVSVMETSVNIRWVSGYDYGHNQSYIVMSYNKGKYTDIASFNSEEGDHGFSNVSHVIGDLQSGLMYNFSVIAKNSKGEGPVSSNSVAFTTAPYKEYTVVEGGNVFVICNGTLPGDDVYWSTEAGAVAAEGKQLAIFNTTRNDMGMYICNDVVKTTIVIKETVFLNVQYPEKILDVKVPSTDVNVNGTYVITVNVEGNPTPTTTITQNGNVLFQANKTGMFNASVDHVICSEFGTINLTCSNTLGNETKTAVMLVHCPPSPKGTVHTKFQPRLGENITLHIENIGYPYPVYTWTFNGKILKNQTSQDVDDYNVKTVKIADFGLYKLVMSNALGSSAVNFSLEAYGPPAHVTKLGVNNITTSTANITFESGFDYGAHQNFIIQTFNGKTYEDIDSFEDKSKDHRPANVSHVMSDLEVDTMYNFSIVANNSRGRGERSPGFVAFTTNEPRNTFVVVEGNNFTVTCNASAGMSDVHWENDHEKRVGSGKIFTIANVSRMEGGYYKCIGTTETSVKHNLEIIFLDVHYSAKILSLNTSDQYMHVNDTFFVWVEEEGKPQPLTVLTKLRDGSLFFPGEVNFTIEGVNCTDTAKYLLNVSNEVGSDTAELEMFVYCPPTIDPHVNNTRKFVPRLGDLTTLQIQDYGYPYPNHTWTYNFTTLQHNDTDISSEITVTSSMNDYGSYNTIMVNEFGSVKVGFELIGAGPPEAVSELKIINSTYNSVALSWRSGFDYKNKQTFMVMTTAGKRLQNFTDATRVHEMAVYTVTGLVSSTAYNLTVLSRNVDGNSDAPKGTVFFTTAAAPSPLKGNKHTGAIVGGVIGALCIVAILVAAGIFLKRRRDSQMNYQNIDEHFN